MNEINKPCHVCAGCACSCQKAKKHEKTQEFRQWCAEGGKGKKWGKGAGKRRVKVCGGERGKRVCGGRHVENQTEKERMVIEGRRREERDENHAHTHIIAGRENHRDREGPLSPRIESRPRYFWSNQRHGTEKNNCSY